MAARVTAISQGQNVIVNILSNHELEIGPDLNDNDVLDEDEAQITDIRGASPTIYLSATSNLTFDARGSSSNASVITLSNAGKTRKIMITLAGIVKIDE